MFHLRRSYFERDVAAKDELQCCIYPFSSTDADINDSLYGYTD
jgi:hypothetical protein